MIARTSRPFHLAAIVLRLEVLAAVGAAAAVVAAAAGEAWPFAALRQMLLLGGLMCLAQAQLLQWCRQAASAAAVALTAGCAPSC